MEEVPVCVEETPTEEACIDSECYPAYSDSSIEVNHLEQLMAQAIVFSFLQNKKNKGILKTFLVPAIGICGKKLVIHLYDCLEDVLLEIFPLPWWLKGLHGQKELNLRAVDFYG